MLLQKKHPDIDPRVLILEPIEVCSLLNRKKLNAQEIMGRTHGIARGAADKGQEHSLTQNFLGISYITGRSSATASRIADGRIRFRVLIEPSE